MTAIEESINTAFVDMSTSMHDGPEKILATAKTIGIPPAEADPTTRASRAPPATSSPTR